MGFWFPCRDLIVIRFSRTSGVEMDLQSVTKFTDSVARRRGALRTLWLDIEISVNNLGKGVISGFSNDASYQATVGRRPVVRRTCGWQTKVIKGKQ
jgi:hypothetical protein